MCDTKIPFCIGIIIKIRFTAVTTDDGGDHVDNDNGDDDDRHSVLAIKSARRGKS